jgi:hypothetical protein
MILRRGKIEECWAGEAECSPLYYFAALPVPDSGIICGLPIALSLTTNVPFCAVVSAGLKVTKALQLFPGAKVVVHWLVTAKGAAVVSPEIVTLILELLELLFLIITFLALLVLPTVVLLPKATGSGLNVRVPASGV